MRTIRRGSSRLPLVPCPHLNFIRCASRSPQELRAEFEKAQQARSHAKPHAPRRISNVQHVVAVASGKGGVGKSTIASNLSLGLERIGLRVGLLDADIYGPSLPHMMNLKGERAAIDEDGYLEPLVNYNVACMSLGLMVAAGQAVAWRAPMAVSMLERLIWKVRWPILDVLVVDLPPGTGDVHLALSQTLALSGAVLVCTPQDVALADLQRGAELFERVKVPLIGLVENMGAHVCSNCGHVDEVFGSGGAQREAEKRGIRFLGTVPLDRRIREGSDVGAPVIVAASESESAKALSKVAEQVWEVLQNEEQTQPQFVIEE